MQIATFDTDVADEQWKLLEPLLPKAKRRGRPRTPLRPVLNAVLYIVKSGCPWRLSPRTFPPWKTVYHHFHLWSRDHAWPAINDRLRALVRATHNKHCRPTGTVLDSQTVLKCDFERMATECGLRIIEWFYSGSDTVPRLRWKLPF